MRRAVILAVVLAAGAAAVAAGAVRAQQAQQQTADIQKVRDNLFVITGGGGNTAAFITDAGVVLVDTKLANWGERIMEKVRSVTDKPVTTIINTHTHGDHVGSNEHFQASVQIVAHENTEANMKRMEALKGKPHAMPDRTFTDRLTVGSGRDRIDLYYFGRGHTNGDALVVFPQLRTMHTGDLFPGRQVPFMDDGNGGSGVEYPGTLARAAQGIRGVETVIPGHSAVTDWAAFVEFGDFVREFVSSVEAAAAAGKSAEQAAAELKLSGRFSGYTTTRAKANVDVIYRELKK
jgi:glyoxylase-like metal-dependent hydrolase (beta-lactamase superfamily II)